MKLKEKLNKKIENNLDLLITNSINFFLIFYLFLLILSILLIYYGY